VNIKILVCQIIGPAAKYVAMPRYANGHISATGDPIQFMFGSRVGFSGSADRMALFLFISVYMAAGRHLGNFRMAISAQRVIRYTSCLVLG